MPGSPAGAANTAPPGNATCLQCHDPSHKLEVPGADDEPRTLLTIAPDAYGASVHGKMACTDCHTGITDNPSAGSGHKPEPGRSGQSVGCADCHEKLWATAKQNMTAEARPRLGIVVENIEAYRKSFHARQPKPRATCDDCHNTHVFNVPPRDDPARAKWRIVNIGSCAANCHSEELDEYKQSIHGKETLEKGNVKSAVCVDCHTTHNITKTTTDKARLTVTANCGGCHAENYDSYRRTYHGQINTLGYTYTAKCFDCHGSHGILAVKDPESNVDPKNRIETCKSCHNGKKGIFVAPAGFVSFQPHAHANDFARYPQVWIAYRMMVGLLLGTFAFFWIHTALWFFREYRERQQARLRPHVKTEALAPELQGKQIRRFSRTWRLGHILFAVSLMLLTLTGMPLFYPDSVWAPLVINAVGGPKVAGLIHRVNAVIFAGVFVWHLGYVGLRIWRDRKTFRWLGPDSLIPNWQDIKDIFLMFRWFVGRGPRPVFDRWTYWEKFDYWAPFWGVTIVGFSGLMMWLPTFTGAVLPGWVFNVAAIFHGEEAFLAVVFLFTVHFFNNHFRPDKFPLEIVMFTGSMELERFKDEHPLQYQRLVEAGELQQYLVDAPSARMTLASKVLGFTLIAFGMILLFGVSVGFFNAN
jgi:cytochrome b subunit of formate dehydrogenase/nitrate/TMAO reductase-like tetraheme cytochrome c subunit